MKTNGLTGNQPAGRDRCIAHSVCHDCARHEELHRARRPEDAKQLAVDAAIEHARATGHDVDEDLILEPVATTTRGPDVADTEVVQR